MTIHLILSKRTRGLVGAAELALMKPTSWLINTSRGPIVDEGALVRVLTSRAIAGAALDVFDTRSGERLRGDGGDAEELKAGGRQDPLMYFGQTEATVRAHG